MSDERVLDLIGRLEGTNKSQYGYLESYEPTFRPFRDKVFSLLEIGVYQGASLRTWRGYFAKAQIVGLDINPQCRQYADDRISIEIGSQEDPEVLDRIMTRYSPLIVVDDGSHLAHHVLFSFERIFPRLPGGGLYVVEDAYMHFGKRWQEIAGLSKIRCSEYFMTLADRLASRELAPQENHGMAKYLFDHVESVAFVQGAIVLRKKQPPLDAGQKIAAARALAAQSGGPDRQRGLLRIIWEYGGSLEEREQIIRTAIAEHGANPEALFMLADLLERRHKTAEAIAVLEEAEALEDGWSLFIGRLHVLARLATLYLRIAASEQAEQSARRLRETSPSYWEARHLLVAALEQAGKFSEAIEEAEHAAALVTDGPSAETIKADISRIRAKVAAGAERPVDAL